MLTFVAIQCIDMLDISLRKSIILSERIEGNPGIQRHNGGPSIAGECISIIVHDGG